MRVSVCVITYNQETYIRECLESIVNQKVDFDFEVVIGEDRSTDKTYEICQEYAAKYPQLIRLLRRDNNLGMMQNWAQTMMDCKGDYIAFCEGDDYWTDMNKLQKQSDFMLANPEVSFTFHGSEVLFKDRFLPHYKHKFYRDKQIVETKYFLAKAGARYCSASVMLKKEVVENLPEWIYKCNIADYPLMFLALEKGKIAYLDDVMCVYRQGAIGSWSATNLKFTKRVKFFKKMVEMNQSINKNTNGKYRPYLKLNLASYIFHKMVVETKEKLFNF